jgi:phytoene dehydrogenase-like protein
MSRSYDYDAVVVGAGPNGLAAAITLARAGCSVLVIEAKDTVGGGTRSAELTLPGFVHDICSAIHPLGVGSPFFRDLPLEQFGLDWVFPTAELAHPLDDSPTVIIERSVKTTAESLAGDGRAYRLILGPLVGQYDRILREFLGPLRLPRYPLTLAHFGLLALWPASTLAKLAFRDARTRAVFAGMAAHSIMPIEWPTTAAFGLMLTILAHAVGWPMARGGSQKIGDALAVYLGSIGGKIETGRPVQTLDELPSAKVLLLDITPRQLIRIAGHRLPSRYRNALERYRYGPGVCKIDYALDGPIPWRDPECLRAATVHLGGTLAYISAGERAIWRGEHPEKPFVLLAQHTLFDPSRAPAGKHTAWAYCHVPHGSTVDMTAQIEGQIERFAPGFRERVLARHVRTAEQYEHYNANYIGGDINGGVQDFGQLFTRPVARLIPYSTPLKGVYLCSSSTPPGGGVHGMCGYFAAQAALIAMK